jgi:membrane-bound lytic murein transglycosylase F
MLSKNYFIPILILALLLTIFVIDSNNGAELTVSSAVASSEFPLIEIIEKTDVNIEQSKPIGLKLEPKALTHFRSIDEIKKSGFITAIKLSWETKNRLPRSGMNSLYHHDLLESFSEESGIKIRWLTVNNLEEMFQALEQYKADIIPRHLTITDNRLKRLNFTYPIASDQEVVIARLGSANISAKDDITVTLPVSSSYIENVSRQYPHWTIKEMSQAISSDDLADKIVSGDIQYSVIELSEFTGLAQYRKDIKIVLTLPQDIQQAWAVHKNNHQLVQRLNEVISFYHANEIAEPNRTIDFNEIREKKIPLRIITRNSPETYFLWKGELVGFEYELMRKFSKVYKTKIEIKVADSYQEMLEMLQRGEGDVIAAGLTRTAERLKDYQQDGLLSSIRYNLVDEMLVANKDSKKIKRLEDLKGRSITVRKSSSFWKTAQQLAKDHGAIIIQANEMIATETLIAQVDKQLIDLTIADSNLLKIEKNFRDGIVTPLTLNSSVPHAYIVRKNNPKLLEYLNQFIRTQYRTTFYNVVKNRYFYPTKREEKIMENRLVSGSTLSPYDKIVKPNARDYNFDWRLIVSQMYQESKFNPTAKSYAGAMGLMQVLPRTADDLGIKDLTDPEQSIIAGVRYLDWTRDRFSNDLPVQEQILFSLASYNAGFGHVKDAQRLARQLGLKDDKWFNNVEHAMLLLQQRSYYKNARFGYVRGSEPVKYVYNIHQRYLGYVESTSE